MFQSNVLRTATRIALLFVCLSTFCQPMVIHAQSGESVQELKQRSAELVKQQKYTEALPILEKLSKAEPNNPETFFYLGFALIAQGHITNDDAARRALRIRARNAFLKSKDLGSKEPVVDALIQSLPADGSGGNGFSQNANANVLMVEAEAFFSQGKLDDALKNYQRALQLDPALYEAALFSDIVFSQRSDFPQA